VAVTWASFQEAEPDLAESVRERFESHRHAVMATLRRDGAPRLSGMEAPIRDGHLWLAMDDSSRKTDDLRRDARLSIHSAPDDEQLTLGDARVDGRAVPALDRSVGTLANLGVEVLVEIGPQPVLGPKLTELWPGTAPAILASQHAEASAKDSFVAAVAGAYEAGLAIEFKGLFAGEVRARISLPRYPFQRRRHWISAPRRTT